MASAIEKYEENVTSKRCGRATFTECVPLPPEARGLNASTAGSHKTYNSWRARSCFEHTKQAKVGGQSAGPKACLALLAERKQQRMLSRRRERLPFPLSRSPVRTFRVLHVLGRFIEELSFFYGFPPLHHHRRSLGGPTRRGGLRKGGTAFPPIAAQCQASQSPSIRRCTLRRRSAALPARSCLTGPSAACRSCPLGRSLCS